MTNWWHEERRVELIHDSSESSPRLIARRFAALWLDGTST